MNKTYRKVKAIYQKEMVDMIKNVNALIMFALPLVFAVLYSKVMPIQEALGADWLLMLTVALNLCMAPLSLLPMIIAEEKEKNTLRTLMLSNVSAMEFIGGKVLAVYTATELINLLLFILIGVAWSQLSIFLLVTSLGSICLLVIGAVFGLLARDQMSTGLYSVTGMLLFLLPTVFSSFNSFFSSLSKIIPTAVIFRLFTMMVQGEGNWIDWVSNLAVLLIWTFCSLIVFKWIFKRKGIDR